MPATDLGYQPAACPIQINVYPVGALREIILADFESGEWARSGLLNYEERRAAAERLREVASELEHGLPASPARAS